MLYVDYEHHWQEVEAERLDELRDDLLDAWNETAQTPPETK